jgi:hypothetical protein
VIEISSTFSARAEESLLEEVGKLSVTAKSYLEGIKKKCGD